MAAWCSNAGEINQHNKQQQEWSEESDEAGLVTLYKPSQLIRISWWGVRLGASAWTNATRLLISTLHHSFTWLSGINQKGSIFENWKKTNNISAEILILAVPSANTHFFFQTLKLFTVLIKVLMVTFPRLSYYNYFHFLAWSFFFYSSWVAVSTVLLW